MRSSLPHQMLGTGCGNPNCDCSDEILPWNQGNPLKFHPIISMLAQSILLDLWSITGVKSGEPALALLTAFARWVFFLPASESNHHAMPYGLLWHSLSVAWRFTSSFQLRPDIGRRLEELKPEDKRPWLLAGVAAAVLHDCGKLFDMVFRSVPAGRIWNPLREPVTTFINRLAKRSDVVLQYVPGRGLKGHEAKGRALIPVILPPKTPTDLTEKTLAIYDACASHHEIKDPQAHWPAAWFAALILDADRKDSAADLALVTGT